MVGPDEGKATDEAQRADGEGRHEEGDETFSESRVIPVLHGSFRLRALLR